MSGVNGCFHPLYRLVKLPFRLEGVRPKQETIQPTVEVLHDTIAPGFAEWDQDRLHTQIQTNAHQFARRTRIQVAASKIQAIIHFQAFRAA